MRRIQATAVVCALALCAAIGWAGEEPSRASQAFDEGLKAMLAGDYDKGCPLLQESYESEPMAGALFTLAECEAKWGKTARAVGHYEDYLAEVEAMSEEERKEQGPRPAVASKALEKLEPEVGRVTVVVPASASSWTVVEIDGERVDRAKWGKPQPVDPGQHEISAKAPGEESTTAEVEVAAGESKRVELDVPASDDDDDDDDDGSSRDKLVYAEIAGGGGLGIPTAGFDPGPAFFLEGGAALHLGPGNLAFGLRMAFQTYSTEAEGQLPCPSPGPCVAADGGRFSYDVNEQALSFGLPIAYRFLAPDGVFIPYLGAAPTLFLVKASSTAYESENTQTDTQFGIQLLAGGQFTVGPGGIFIEADYQYSGLSHSITGDSSLSAVLIAAGYRAVL